VLAVGVEDQIGRPVLMARRQLAELLAGRRVDQKDLAVVAIRLAAAAQRQQLAVRRVGRGRDVDFFELAIQLALRLAGCRVPQANALS